MENEFSRVIRAPFGITSPERITGHSNFLNEGCEYLDLELGEALTAQGDVAGNSESAPVQVDPINGPR